jgi:hypothetical protein
VENLRFLLFRNEGKYVMNDQNVQSVKIAVGEKFRRSKMPSVKIAIGQNGRWSKLRRSKYLEPL